MTFTRCVSSLLIQARVRGPRPSCLHCFADAADELGDPADGPPDRARRQAPDLGDVAIEFGAIDPELGELLVEQVVGHAVEEQFRGEDDDDEVVEPADDRHVVGDQVATEDEIAGRTGQQRLALHRHPLVHHERGDEPRVHRDAAGDRQEREQRQGATEPGAASRTLRFASPCHAPCVVDASYSRGRGV